MQILYTIRTYNADIVMFLISLGWFWNRILNRIFCEIIELLISFFKKNLFSILHNLLRRDLLNHHVMYQTGNID